MGDLADRLAEEARAMFANLPPGEIEDDERLFFTVDRGRLIVRRGEIYYSYHEGRTSQYRPSEAGLIEIRVYRDGHLVESETMDPEKKGARAWPPWMN